MLIVVSHVLTYTNNSFRPAVCISAFKCDVNREVPHNSIISMRSFCSQLTYTPFKSLDHIPILTNIKVVLTV